jgi:hypothetical protein
MKNALVRSVVPGPVGLGMVGRTGRAVPLIGLLLLAACGGPSSGVKAAATPFKDSTAAIQFMVDTGQTIPPGTFMVNNIHVDRTLRGSDRDLTTLKEIVPWFTGRGAMISMPTDGAVVEDVTLDGGNGFAIGTRHSYTTLQRARVLGGDPVGTFALYYSGIGAQAYAVGNQVLDTIIDETSDNDGFSFSYQKDALIKNITHHGSRLALYHAQNVHVENYDFTPRVVGVGSFNYTGLWVTPSSDRVTILHWRGGHPRWGAGNGSAATNSSMTDATVDGMMVGDVNGFVLDQFTGSLHFNRNLASATLTVFNSQLVLPVYNPVPLKVHATWVNTIH